MNTTRNCLNTLTCGICLRFQKLDCAECWTEKFCKSLNKFDDGSVAQ